MTRFKLLLEFLHLNGHRKMSWFDEGWSENWKSPSVRGCPVSEMVDVNYWWVRVRGKNVWFKMKDGHPYLYNLGIPKDNPMRYED